MPRVSRSLGHICSSGDRGNTERLGLAGFRDPVLDRLIRVAYEQNLSLVSAGTRVLEARAQLGVAIGEFSPQLQHGAGSMIYDRPSHADPTAAPQLGIGFLGHVPPRLRIFCFG